MAAPVVGPITKSLNGTGADVHLVYEFRQIYRQAKPYDMVLPYWSTYSSCSRNTGSNVNDPGVPRGARWPAAFDFADLNSNSRNETVSRCYEKLKDEVSSRADLGTTLAELGQTVGLLRSSAQWMVDLFRMVRRGELKQLRRHLGLQRTPNRRYVRSKGMAGVWLSYSFAIAPTVQTMYDCVDVLQKPINSVWVSASTSRPMGVLMESHYVSPQNGDMYFLKHDELVVCERYGVRMGGQVRVENPNLWLANQLGLVNPASILWELTPWSFVADWIGNLGQVIGSMTDFLGLNLSNTYTTEFMDVSSDQRHQYSEHRWKLNPNGDGTWVPYLYGSNTYSHKGRCRHTWRKQGLTYPSLFIRGAFIPSWKRAANAVALMVGFLPRK